MTSRQGPNNLSARAQRDLAALLSRSAESYGRAKARKMRSAVLDRCLDIADGKGIGHIRPDVHNRRPLRFWPVPPFVIVYDAKTRLVIRILHGRRDIPAVLG